MLRNVYDATVTISHVPVTALQALTSSCFLRPMCVILPIRRLLGDFSSLLPSRSDTSSTPASSVFRHSDKFTVDHIQTPLLYLISWYWLSDDLALDRSTCRPTPQWACCCLWVFGWWLLLDPPLPARSRRWWNRKSHQPEWCSETNHVSGTVYRRQFATQHYQLLLYFLIDLIAAVAEHSLFRCSNYLPNLAVLGASRCF